MLTRGRESEPDGPVTGVLTLTPMAPETQRQRGRRHRRDHAGSRPAQTSGSCRGPWLLGGVKTLSYGINVAAIRKPSDGAPTTCCSSAPTVTSWRRPTATAVWLADGQLHTTPAGRHRRAGLDHPVGAVRCGRAGRAGHPPDPGHVAELLAAEGVWLVSSGRGVARSSTLDGTALDGKPG